MRLNPPAILTQMSRHDRYQYRVCGLRVESNVPFSIAEDAPLDGALPDINFRLLSRDASRADHFTSPVEANFIKNGAGQPSIAVHSVNGVYRLECVNSKTRVNFVMPRDGRWVDCYPSDETSQEEIELWLFGLVMSFILQSRGVFTLHAAAVASGSGGAIAFLGSNGYGKSTLAFYFAKKGHALLTDDVLPLVEMAGRLLARSGSPSINLWHQSLDEIGSTDAPVSNKEAARGKHRYPLDKLGLSQCGSEIPLETIYFLEPRVPNEYESVQIEPVSRAQALIDLLAYTRANSTIELPAQKHLLALYSNLLSQAKVRRLIYPRGFEQLPALYQAVLHDNP